ncbi:MAG: hydrogenase expression/formation protein HypE [Candidatus Omnitrophica bacterium]|nr:hydrogenase expression/formation protein HypE [Candidatus Omnitrophota bacterium]
MASGPACPIPLSQYPQVLLAHGGGGKLMSQLIEKVFLAAFSNPLLETRHDGAVFALNQTRIAFTTDSYVVKPLFFPGGDIGSLAVNGTVNDLAMCGARPLYLSCGFILEEGLRMETLERIAQSMKESAAAARVQIVTGDTKVVDKGKGDSVFINTAGIGLIEHELVIAPGSVRTGDVVLLSGDLGRHGIAIMAAREGLSFESTIQSDCAAVAGLVMKMLHAGIRIHCMRDLTRGGLASALVEIAEASRLGIHLEGRAISVHPEVEGACEMLGLDPLYVANEGRFVVLVPPADTDRTLEIMHEDALGAGASRIGQVSDEYAGMVTLTSAIGTRRFLDRLSGEQLPRIC